MSFEPSATVVIPAATRKEGNAAYEPQSIYLFHKPGKVESAPNWPGIIRKCTQSRDPVLPDLARYLQEISREASA
jgi:hypothetical protein